MGLSDLEPALGSTSSEPAFKSTSQLSDHQKVKLIRNIHKPFASHLASSSLDSRFESTLSQPESPIYQPRLHDTCHEHPILRDQIAGISSNHIFQISRSKKSTSTTPKSCKQGQGTIMGLSDLEPALGSTSSEPAFKSTFQLSDHQKVKLVRNIHKPFASHLASSSLEPKFESTLSQPESPIYQPRLHDTCHEHPILRDQIAGISSNHTFQISRSKKSTSTTPKSCKQGQGTIMGLSDLEPALGSTSSIPAFKSTSQLSDHQKVKLVRNIHRPFA